MPETLCFFSGVLRTNRKEKTIDTQAIACILQAIAFLHYGGYMQDLNKTIKRGDIYYADLSPIIGSEQGGIRPVLIIQNDICIKGSPTTIVAAITSKLTKPRMATHVCFTEKSLPRKSLVLLEQIRTIDKSRLSDYIGCLDQTAMKAVDRAIEFSFGIKQKEESPK